MYNYNVCQNWRLCTTTAKRKKRKLKEKVPFDTKRPSYAPTPQTNTRVHPRWRRRDRGLIFELFRSSRRFQVVKHTTTMSKKIPFWKKHCLVSFPVYHLQRNATFCSSLPVQGNFRLLELRRCILRRLSWPFQDLYEALKKGLSRWFKRAKAKCLKNLSKLPLNVF